MSAHERHGYVDLDDEPVSVRAQVDQVAALWRDVFARKELDITVPDVAATSRATLTMVYGLLIAAHAQGEMNDEAYAVVRDVLRSSACAIASASKNPPAAA